VNLDPQVVAKFIEDSAVFFFRDQASFPSADEYKMLGIDKSRRFVSGVFGYVRMFGQTLCAAATTREDSPSVEERKMLTQRCGLQLMNLVAGRLIEEQKAEASKLAIPTPEIVVP